MPHTPAVTWTLEARDDISRQDGCWHCENSPGYPHRHWRQLESAPQHAPAGRVLRALFRIYGGGDPTANQAGR